MIVDKKGSIFEDRRKTEDRRKKNVQVPTDTRKGTRREEGKQQTKNK